MSLQGLFLQGKNLFVVDYCMVAHDGSDDLFDYGQSLFAIIILVPADYARLVLE